jgi:glutathionylspermidine synthase
VVQWHWLEDLFPARDQFNSLHERLIARWKIDPLLPGRRIEFCSMDDAEDRATVAYLLDTARQAGLNSSLFRIDEIGWDGQTFLGPTTGVCERSSNSIPGSGWCMKNSAGI